MTQNDSLISSAVAFVCQKLISLDLETATRVQRALYAEAERITNQARHNGAYIDLDLLIARLDGFVVGMTQELRNKEPNRSPSTFPIFNVSHNPHASSINPANYPYGEGHKQVYSTFTKQAQSLPPSFETKHFPVKQKINPTSSLNYQQDTVNQSFEQPPHAPIYKHNSSTYNYTPVEVHQPAHRRSSPHSYSYGEVKPPGHSKSKASNKQNEYVQVTKKIYSAPNGIIDSETVEDLMNIANEKSSSSPQSGESSTRIIIVDRHKSKSPDRSQPKRIEQSSSTTIANIVTSTNNVFHEPVPTGIVQPPIYYMDIPIYQPAPIAYFPYIHYYDYPKKKKRFSYKNVFGYLGFSYYKY